MSQRLILVIDDEVDTIDLVEATFRRRGYEVLGAWTGSAGLQLARERTPAIILIDLMLPEIDGFAVCQQLRHDPVTAHIPQVILSARASMTDQSDALAAGADRYLTKPVSIRALVGVVEELLPRAGET